MLVIDQIPTNTYKFPDFKTGTVYELLKNIDFKIRQTEKKQLSSRNKRYFIVASVIHFLF
jgi:hypothetical protein